MNALKQSIDRFIHAAEKHGARGEFRPSGAPWPAELPSSAELSVFYEQYEPVNSKIDSGMSPLRFFDINSLPKAQLGYRWHGITSERLSKWPESYVVIADDFGGGKPIVAVTDQAQTPIFAAYDTKLPFKIAESMSQFFAAMAKLVELVYGEYEIFEIYTEDEESIKPEFITDLETRLKPVLGDENFSRFFDYFYG